MKDTCDSCGRDVQMIERELRWSSQQTSRWMTYQCVHCGTTGSRPVQTIDVDPDVLGS